MLKNANPTYSFKEWDQHIEKVEKLKVHINQVDRKRNQQLIAERIVRKKYNNIKPSLNLLNSERRTQIQMSPSSQQHSLSQKEAATTLNINDQDEKEGNIIISNEMEVDSPNKN